MTQRRSLMRLASPLMAGRGVAAMLTFSIPIFLARTLDQDSYGTYKQFFLIASSVYLIGQLGITASLYYFVPRADRDGRGRIIIQTLLGLLGLGAVAAGMVFLGAGFIARRFSNPSLLALALPLALYIWAFLGAAPLEIMLTTSKRTGWAGLLYAVSDLVRTTALILPILLGGSMVALAWAAAGWGLLRLASAWALALSGKIGRPQLPTVASWKEQLRYSLPFAGAVLLATVQIQLPQYVVAGLTDTATYAVFAVGVLQIPLTDMFYTPVAEVMMVRLAASGADRAPPVFREAVARLVVFFLPLTAVMLAVGPVLIPTFYTTQYLAAVPVFLIALCELPLLALPVDGLLRSLDMNGKIFRVSLMRLAVSVVIVPLGLEVLGLSGAMLGYVVTQWTGKLLLLRAAARRLGVSPSSLIPWTEVQSWTLRAAAVFGAATLFRIYGPGHGWIGLAGAGVVAGAVWGLALLSARELRSKAPVASADAGLSMPSMPPVAAPTPQITASIKKVSLG